MLLSGDLECHSGLFVMDAIMFYMKAASLNRQTKLLRKTVENAQNAIRNSRCCLWMSKLNPFLSANKLNDTLMKASTKPFGREIGNCQNRKVSC